jgi:hypothetical protein
MEIFLAFVLSLLFAWLTSHFAKKQGRDPIIWFLIGLVLGVFGLFILFLLPNKNEEKEIEEAVPVDIDPNAVNSTLIDAEQPMTIKPEIDELLDKQWYYLDSAHQQQGPIGIKLLKHFFLEEKINKSTHVWSEEMPEWKTIEEMVALNDYLNE